jgi:hypothetical protein
VFAILIPVLKNLSLCSSLIRMVQVTGLPMPPPRLMAWVFVAATSYSFIPREPQMALKARAYHVSEKLSIGSVNRLLFMTTDNTVGGVKRCMI